MTSVVMVVVLDIYLARMNKAAKAGQMLIEEREGWLYTL
jgi:hypothetical protein